MFIHEYHYSGQRVVSGLLAAALMPNYPGHDIYGSLYTHRRQEYVEKQMAYCDTDETCYGLPEPWISELCHTAARLSLYPRILMLALAGRGVACLLTTLSSRSFFPHHDARNLRRRDGQHLPRTSAKANTNKAGTPGPTKGLLPVTSVLPSNHQNTLRQATGAPSPHESFHLKSSPASGK